MIDVRRIQLREIRLPLREPFQISSGVMSERRIALCELHDASGVGTWSECVAGEAPNYSPETIDTAGSPSRVGCTSRARPHVRGAGRGARCARARTSAGTTWRRPRSRWGCGGSPRRRLGMPLVAAASAARASEIATGISLGIQSSPEALVEKAGAALAEGYRKVKIKIKPGSDVAVRARGPRGAGPECAADGRCQQRLHARRHRRARRAGRPRI